MRRARIIFVALVAACVTLGVPGPVRAAEYVPRAESAGIPIEAFVVPGQPIVREVSLPWRANMAAVSYEAYDPSGEGLTMRVRTLSDGRWTAWRALSRESEDAPDGAEGSASSERIATDPMWIGAVNRVAVSVEVAATAAPIRNLRLEISNTAGDARPVNPLVRAYRIAWSYLNATPVEADAEPGQPTIIRRSQWGADESRRGSSPGLARSIKAVFVHHTDNGNSYTKSKSRALVRGIYRFHTSNRGYSDIAYNFLIDKYGQIFEGRAGGITKPVIGAHTKGFNTSTVGIALIGNFTRTRPSKQMVAALNRLVAWRLDIVHLPVTGSVRLVSAGNERYPRGRAVSFNRVSGHRNAKPTACPGTAAYRLLPSVRRSATAIGSPKIYFPSVSTSVLRPDGDGVAESIRFTAKFSQVVDWTLTITHGSSAAAQTFTGSGSSFDQRWDGTGPTGVPVATGLYRWRLGAQDDNEHSARAAAGAFYVVNDHPSGTLLRDDAGRYVISGLQHSEVGDIAYRSTYGTLAAVSTGPAERDRYSPALAPLAPRAGALLQDPDGNRYIWTGVTLRRFAVEPEDIFAALGYRAEALISAEQSVVDALPPGLVVDSAVAHPDGSLIADGNGATYVVDNGQLRPIGALARASWYRSIEVVAATEGDLGLVAGTAFPVRDGTLLSDPAGGSPWIIDQGSRRQFVTDGMFAAMGYRSSMLLRSSKPDFASVPEGEILG
ncbi:MAG: peptidoglycan recognition protein [Actinomycetota bacterium]